MRILIANRGEIAARLIRTVKRIGHTAIALELIGESSPATNEADEILYFSKEHTALQDTFLSEKNILELAGSAKVDAIHPGYGFLSESPHFAELTEERGIIFIGPSAQTLKILSDKVCAKELASSCGIPTIPSFNISSITALSEKEKKGIFEKAENIGYPLMVKAAYGGGGRGMREVFSKVHLFENIEIASSEAERAFGNGALFIEKLIRPAQHIEIQVIGDKSGDCVHLYERDCSLQRKHQKLIEFAPSINIHDKTLNRLYGDSLKLAVSAKLSNAATMEFLVNRDTKEYYFIESNPRLQVEHTITEEITGFDIVELQINSCLGHPLPKQDQIKKQGFAIQARICAEIPEKNYEPSTGRLEILKFPNNLRIESGYNSTSNISTEYDSLIAKLIVHGTDIKTVKEQLLKSLNETIVKGISTNLHLLIQLVSLNSFMHDGLSVDFIESTEFSSMPSKETLANLIESIVQIASDLHSSSFKKSTSEVNPFNLVEKPIGLKSQRISLRIDQLEIDHISPIEKSPERTQRDVNIISLNVDTSKNFTAELMFQGYFVRCATLLESDDLKNSIKINSGEIDAPLPCQILKVFAKENDEVELGQKLVTFESMKTEYSINAPFTGIIEKLRINPGDRLSKGDRILKVIAK